MIPGFNNPRTQTTAVQGLITILAGLLLGLYILIIYQLPSKWIPLLLAAALFPFIALAVGNVRRILLALILLDIPLQLDIALGSYWSLNYTGAINGYIVSLTTICLAILYLLWALERIFDTDTPRQPIVQPNRYLILYFAITCLTMFTGELQRLSSFEIFLLVQVLFLYFYVINQIHDRHEWMFLMAVLLIGLTGESLIIILMQVIGQGFSIAGILGNIYADAATANGISRIGGTLVSANTAGSYISLLLAPAFGVLIAQQKLVYKWLALAAFVFGMVALVLTGSRGAWVATFLSFVILGSYALRKGWLNFKVAGTGIFVSLLIGLIFSGPLYERIFGYDFGSAISRAQQYDVAIQIIKDHPVLGVGVNNYFNALRQYLMWNPDREVFRWVVHNKYLLVWAETGIFGLLFFLMFLGSTIRQGFRAMQFNHPSFSPIALGFAAAITGQMVHMFFDVFHSRPQVQSLWLAAGLVMVLERISRPDEVSLDPQKIE